MRKNWFLLVLAVVVAALGAAAWYEPTRTVRGWAHGEPFYDGRSASGWAERLASSDPKDLSEAPERLVAGKADALPVLTRLLTWRDPTVRWKAADALGKIGPPAAESAPALAERLKDPDPYVRRVAAQSLGAINSPHPDVIYALVGRLVTEDRDLVIRPLSEFGPAAAPAVKNLIEIVTNTALSPTTRWEAIRTLGKIGPPAHEAGPALAIALNDPDELVREHAAESLGEIKLTQATQALTRALADPAPRVRRDAVRSLGQLGRDAKSAVPEIKKLLDDKDDKVRDAAKTALRRIEGGE
jgi:HEAT repeat protein